VRNIIILGFALILLSAAPAFALVGPGQPLAKITLPDTAGKEHRLADLVKDKVALIVYWSLTCTHCRVEMPKLLALGRSYQGNPFVLLTVNTDGKAMIPAVKTYAAQADLPRPWLMDLGPDDSLPLADAYDLIATPAVLVLDKDGKLVLAQELKPNMDEMKKAIRSAF